MGPKTERAISALASRSAPIRVMLAALGAALALGAGAGQATPAREQPPRLLVAESETPLGGERVPPAPARLAQAEPRACDYAACEARYRSFRASDCSFQPYQGPRRACTLGRRGGAPVDNPRSDAVSAAPTAAPSPAPADAPAQAAPQAAFSDAETAEEADAAPREAATPPKAAAVVSATGDLIDDWVDVAVLAGFGVFWLLAYMRLWVGAAR
ncbi:MAG: BA14K family protein [Pseudomonadota bacterium]